MTAWKNQLTEKVKSVDVAEIKSAKTLFLED